MAEENTATEPQATETTQPDPDSGLKSALEKEREQRRAFEKEAKAGREALAKLAEIEEANKDANQKAIDAATKQAREEAANETASRYQRRIVTAEIKAAAGGKLADPMDAVRLLDLSEFELDDNDELDPKKVQKAIDDLLEAKPYLKAGGASNGRQTASFDQGHRSTSDSKPSVAAGAERYAAQKSRT